MLILEYDSTEIVPGGAGNAANNVAALAARRSRSASPAGTNRPAAARGAGAARVDVAGVVRPAGYRTPTKTRILAGGVHSAKQQVVRIDRATRPALTDATCDRRRARRLARAAASCDAMLVSDYGTGLVTPGRGRRGGARRAPQRPAPGRSCSSTRATRCCGFAA